MPKDLTPVLRRASAGLMVPVLVAIFLAPVPSRADDAAASAPAPSTQAAASAVQDAGSAVKQAVRKSGEAARKVGAVAAVGAASAASGVAATAKKVYQDVKTGVKEVLGTGAGASQPADKAPAK